MKVIWTTLVGVQTPRALSEKLQNTGIDCIIDTDRVANLCAQYSMECDIPYSRHGFADVHLGYELSEEFDYTFHHEDLPYKVLKDLPKFLEQLKLIVEANAFELLATHEDYKKKMTIVKTWLYFLDPENIKVYKAFSTT